MADIGVSEDSARQKEEIYSIGRQYLAQLAPGSPEYNQLMTLMEQLVQVSLSGPLPVDYLGGQVLDQQPAMSLIGQKLVQQQQDRIAAGEAVSPLEERTNRIFEDWAQEMELADYEQDVLDALGGRQIDTPSGEVWEQNVARAQDPMAYFESTFRPQLNLAFDEINRQAATRGLVDSGIPLELSQRAAAELAINEANAREQFRQQQLANFAGTWDVGQALGGRGQQVGAARLALEQGREEDLTRYIMDLGKTAAAREEALGQRSTERFAALHDEKRAEDAAESQMISSLVGAGLGLGASFLIPGVGPLIGTQLGAMLGGGAAPNSYAGLASAQRSGESGSSVWDMLSPSRMSDDDLPYTLQGIGGLNSKDIGLVGSLRS